MIINFLFVLYKLHSKTSFLRLCQLHMRWVYYERCPMFAVINLGKTCACQAKAVESKRLKLTGFVEDR